MIDFKKSYPFFSWVFRPCNRSLFLAIIVSVYPVLSGVGSLFTAAPAHAADGHMAIMGHDHAHSRAPIGVMGSHLHKAGHWMLSYRFMHMSMSGNRTGTKSVSPEHIVTNVANPFGMPATLRVVPEKMTMEKHMIGGMFAPTDTITMMAMIPYIRKEMDLITFQGASGTNRLGTFKTQSEGLGDPHLSVLAGLYTDSIHHLNLKIGLSLPVGSIDRQGTVLTPMNTRVRATLPYPMQIGSGSFGFLPGLTYSGNSGHFGWGAQYTATIQMNDNKRDYRLGNRHNLAAWGRFQAQDWLGLSFRTKGWTQGRIQGRDRRIRAPVQTAVPGFQGGDHIDVSFGVDLSFPEGILKGNRLASEFILPVYQNLNGPQMETDWALVIGLQRNF